MGDELSTNLKARGIKVEYQFLGADTEPANTELNKYTAEQNFEIILIINQVDTGIADRIKNATYTSIPIYPGLPNSPLAWGASTKSTILYDEKFKLRLFVKNQSVCIWDATLNTYTDLSKKSVYSDILLKIIKSL